MGRKTARVDRSFISRVVHTAKRTVFGMIPGLSSQRDRQKDLLFKIVLNLGSFAANLTLYERSQLEAQLPMVITKLLVELVK